MPQNREGQNVPQASFRTRTESDWKTLTSDDLFKGKTVVVFSLPGAFTPTCSSTHVPRYNELAPAFFANGVDRIVCISVNDAFVMNEWARTQECGNVLMVPDGNGEFTEKMGMLVDKTELGFGKRSWRYSMLVKDGVIEKMFIEPEKPGDPFEVSDADTMLNHINPKAKKPDQVAILTREGCGYCAKAKALLKELGYAFSEVKPRPQRPLARRRRDHRPRHGAAGLRQRQAHRRARRPATLGEESGIGLFGAFIIGDELLVGKREDKHLSVPDRSPGEARPAPRLGAVPGRRPGAPHCRAASQLLLRRMWYSASAASAPRRTTTRGSAPPPRLNLDLKIHPDAEREIRARFGGEVTPQRLQMGEFPARLGDHPQPREPHPGLLAARAPLRAGLSADGLADGGVGAGHEVPASSSTGTSGPKHRSWCSRRGRAS